MKNGIRSLFGLNKKSKKNGNSNDTIAMDEVYSPNASVSSFSSGSLNSDSTPSTPTQELMQENRGIFRTLEPVWYFQSNLLQQRGVGQNVNEWIRFDDHSQYTLENSFHSRPECLLQHSSIGPCTIAFSPMSTVKAKKERKSMMIMPGKENYSSMPVVQTSNPMGRSFELNKHIRRTIAPAWWFEQDSADGSKGMCRFDYKNQVRLEALSEGRTRLVLTDDAFNVPFTVVLEAPKQPQLKEEVRGFLYLESVPSTFQIDYNNGTSTKDIFNDYIYTQDQDIYSSEFNEPWGSSIVRRFSI